MLLERWQRYWSWLFYGLLLVSTGVAAVDVDGDRRRAVVVVLGAALAVWYWQAVVRPGRVALGRGARGFLVAALGAGIWASLLVLHGLFALLMFSAYLLAYGATLPYSGAVQAPRWRWATGRGMPAGCEAKALSG